MDAVMVSTLEDLRDDESGRSFPRDLLIGCKDALVVFAAGFLGMQDAFWISEAGIRATCLDHDGVRLEEMHKLYPDTWEFFKTDSFEWVTNASRAGRTWDLVSVDCNTNHFERCARLLPLWCRLARKVVIIGTGYDNVEAPIGWKLDRHVFRSDYQGGVYWDVLVRE